MRKSALLFLGMLLAFVQVAVAQTVVTGKITSRQTGTPLSGATIQVKGTNTTAVANDNGDFSIAVPAGRNTLVISYAGYTAKEVSLSNASSIQLDELNADMAEVVVTGYRAAQKKSFAGSAGTVKGAEIAAVPIASFDQALQGRTPGLILKASSGQPGASGSAIIRGRGSINGSTEPIYIVDGVQIAAADFSQLNPNDIENVSVLKDAVATSLYGSRGGNGVIVVTTKRGASGKPRLEVDVYTGWSRLPDFNGINLMTTDEKIDYELRRGGTSLEFYSQSEIDSLRRIKTNWFDEITRTGRTYSVNASAAGGSEKTKYFASVNYFTQEGTVRNTGFDRITGRFNLTQEAGNFTFGLNTTGTVSNFQNTSEANTGIGTPLNAGLWTNPYEQPFVPGRYNAAGNFVRGGTTLTRPRIAESFQPIPTTDLFWNTNNSVDLRTVVSGNAEYKIPFVKGLSVRTVYGIDYRQYDAERFVDRRTYAGGFNPRPTSGQFASFRTSSFNRNFFKSQRVTSTSSINYVKNVGDHSFDAGAYYETVDLKNSDYGRTVFLLETPLQNEAGATINADLIPRITAGGVEAALQSYFGLFNYGYKNRYFFTANIRRDGSSRFGADKRFATFGGVGAAWIISDESFLSSTSGWLSLLKFKASYGTVGNQEGIGAYEAQGTVGGRLYNAGQGSIVTVLENRDLQWEERKKFNTGFDYGFFNNRLTGTLEYYNENTDNLFLPTELSRTTGFNTLTTNIGAVRNSGVEFSANYDIIRKRDLRVGVNANITYNKNQVTKLTDRDTIVSGIVARIVGKPIQSLFLVEYAGVNPANGNALYRKLDGTTTETYNINDRTIVGNSDPVFFGGFGMDVAYKGLAFNAQFSYFGGQSAYNNERNNIENPDYYFDNMNAALLNEWQKPGDITNIPRPGNAFVANTTRFVEDNSFIRLRAVTLSYTMPAAVMQKAKMRSMTFYLSGTNLLTFTKFVGRDPEFASASLTGAQYPALRTVQAGLRLGF
ncbi:MAG TPA: TonB-dependent receptor [Lacibacter sp.]|nr:TonB-dependent receptor [Lacibacter sp.]HMO88629.1 TonB-dependent receptor [Lacibacter sp.]